MSALYLALNAGSSNFKFALFQEEVGAKLGAVFRGRIEGMPANARFTTKDGLGAPIYEKQWADSEPLDHEAAVRYLLKWIDERIDGQQLAACGHRVVHGGAIHTKPVVISDRLLTELEQLIPLAPLHQPQNLAIIRVVTTLRPDLPQIACFDTAFHQTQPRVAQLFALPRDISERGVYRYGFHGLSYEYIASILPALDPRAATGRTVVAHLGNGASLCAMHACKSVATTMGLSPLDGLPMGTRCGALDPAVVFYLMRELSMSAEEVEELLYDKSGLLGVSGRSSDMRALRRHAASDSNAAEAIALFTYRMIREVGALVSVLGGIDALVFTAGIGENDAALRADVLRGLSWLGFQLDQGANEAADSLLTHGNGPRAWIIAADEELMIAQHSRAAIA